MAQVGYGEMVEEMDLFLPSLMDCREQRRGPHVCRNVSPDEVEVNGFPPRVENDRAERFM